MSAPVGARAFYVALHLAQGNPVRARIVLMMSDWDMWPHEVAFALAWAAGLEAARKG